MSASTRAGEYGASRSGFTLVELLAASAITVVVAGIMLAVLTHVSRTWARASGGLTAMQQGEQALDLLARDMQAAVLRRDGRVWLAATIQPDQSGGGDAGGTLGAWSPAVRKPGWASPGAANSSLDLEPATGRIEGPKIEPKTITMTSARPIRPSLFRPNMRTISMLILPA